jgi:dethiobiotin synthetase
MKSKSIFVTGTDTGVGKTLISGMLARYLCHKGYGVITQKWIQTGSTCSPHDIGLHLKLMGRGIEDIKEYLTCISPYVLGFPGSPHLACARERKVIDEGKIKRSLRRLEKRFDFVIVEGVGGALVPFNEKRLVIDIARDLNLSVLIVAANKLGAINHTLLTVEAIERRNMRIAGIVFNSATRQVKDVILKDNPRIVEKLTGSRILGVLPWKKNKDLLYKKFLPIGRSILKALS